MTLTMIRTIAMGGIANKLTNMRGIAARLLHLLDCSHQPSIIHNFNNCNYEVKKSDFFVKLENWYL